VIILEITNRSLVDAAYVTGITSNFYNKTCINVYTGATNTRLNAVETVSAVAVTGATNGIGTTGQNVCLGGALTNDTVICGSRKLTAGDLCGVVLSTSGACDIVLNAKSYGAIYIKSQSGTSTSNDFNGSVGIYADYDAPSGFQIFDNRAGTGATGIVYAADYSLNYKPRSLVDKGYVDSVATGLNIHAAVYAATTSGITLSGSPKNN
jgi:hypothetical protein